MIYAKYNQFVQQWLDPYKRYRHTRTIHALRLGLAVLVATLIARLFDLPHGEWIPITVFVVLGMIQFQGAIYVKALERMWGTLIGLFLGIVLLWLNQYYLHNNWIFFCCIGVISSVMGWGAVGKNGYIPMLAGLTVCMLVGEGGSDWFQGSSIRAMNVIIGALIALAASKIMPLKSTMMWRFLLADNLTACNRQLGAVYGGIPIGGKNWRVLLANQQLINARLVKARSHMAAMMQESKISKTMMDSMQHSHRKIVSSIDLLMNAALKLPELTINEDEKSLLTRHFLNLEQDLRRTAHYLKGNYGRRFKPDDSTDIAVRELAGKLSFEWQGFIWLSINLRMDLNTLLLMLQNSQRRWHTKGEIKRFQQHGVQVLQDNEEDAGKNMPV
ncbi:MAG: FUSC family protein [Neisseria sp.]|uniref:FUSC family protein n=1 Tax=Neisseria sp. TaxID=192066 RepID=UPI0026DA9FE6|nr:FUSC family protein [Neisseria sp.]MDO4641393.1 FUSC family protein [Neisseria sp.]